MNMISRDILKQTLQLYSGKHSELFNWLARKNQHARSRFNWMYNKKPLEQWTAREKENTLGFMLGYNIIQG